MIRVWCVFNGSKYRSDDVYALRAQVKKHLKADHEFWCLSDRIIPAVDCIVPEQKWPGWWSKILLFRYAPRGHNLYLDLDSIVVGPLHRLLSEQFSTPANWGQSGHGGIQSSVMSWAGDYSWITDRFNPDLLTPDSHHPFGRYGHTDYWGDQGFLTAILGDPGAGKVKPMQGVCSYKYHCMGQPAPPAWASVVCFHGDPKAENCPEKWIAAARSTATRI